MTAANFISNLNTPAAQVLNDKLEEGMPLHLLTYWVTRVSHELASAGRLSEMDQLLALHLQSTDKADKAERRELADKKFALEASFDFKIGDNVTRKSGRSNTGRIVSINGDSATVKWSKVFKGFNGHVDMQSTIKMTKLKKIL